MHTSDDVARRRRPSPDLSTASSVAPKKAALFNSSPFINADAALQEVETHITSDSVERTLSLINTLLDCFEHHTKNKSSPSRLMGKASITRACPALLGNIITLAAFVGIVLLWARDHKR
jgi:hypothetical protein